MYTTTSSGVRVPAAGEPRRGDRAAGGRRRHAAARRRPQPPADDEASARRRRRRSSTSAGFPGCDGIERRRRRAADRRARDARRGRGVGARAVSSAGCCATTAEGIGDRQVRNRGTIGGSVAHADPGADYPTVVTALGATMRRAGPGGEREIAADDFFTGVFTTALRAGRARDGAFASRRPRVRHTRSTAIRRRVTRSPASRLSCSRTVYGSSSAA